MNNEQPSYYAIITANVRYDKRLKANEKLMYSEITCLANTKGYCYAGNAYFANLYDVDKTTVSRWVSNLEKCGYIKTQLIKGNDNQIVERRIYITESIPIDKNINTPIDENINTPIDEKLKENITRENNTSLNSFGAQAPSPRKRTKLPLSEREPENDFERIEKRFVNNFEELHKRGIIPSEKPVVNWGQCRRLEKERLDNVGLDSCLEALDRAMDDPFVVQKGYSLAVILSATVFNGLVNGGAKRAIDVADRVNLQDVPF